jgi:hypothetical protein
MMRQASRRSGRNSTEQIPKLIEDIRAKQKNVVWPNPLRNSRGVDELLWRGSSKATPVQRIGIALFGFCYLILAIAMIGIGKEDGSIAFYVVGIAMLLLGARVLFNSVRKAKKKT